MSVFSNSPYLTVADIRAQIDGLTTDLASDTAVQRAEKRARMVINNFTGQNFGRVDGASQVIYGAGDGKLTLPQRLITLTGISAHGADLGAEKYGIFGEGWFLGGQSSPYMTIKQLPEEDFNIYPGGVIYDPFHYRNSFTDDTAYTITGDWGYEEVPEDVIEAELIIIEDQLCPQSEYRDRYLKSISGDGWRYEFTPGAYSGTGSVVADQLLSPYRRVSMTVI